MTPSLDIGCRIGGVTEYLFRIKNFVDISFETIPPLLKTDGTTIPAYHHVYIKYKQKLLVPQQKP